MGILSRRRGEDSRSLMDVDRFERERNKRLLERAIEMLSSSRWENRMLAAAMVDRLAELEIARLEQKQRLLETGYHD